MEDDCKEKVFDNFEDLLEDTRKFSKNNKTNFLCTTDTLSRTLSFIDKNSNKCWKIKLINMEGFNDFHNYEDFNSLINFLLYKKQTHIIPSQNYLLVKKLEDTKKTESGLYVPENVDNMYWRGEILSKGPGAKNLDGEVVPVSLYLSIGDTIVFPKSMALDVGFSNNNLYLVKEDHIVCKLIEE